MRHETSCACTVDENVALAITARHVLGHFAQRCAVGHRRTQSHVTRTRKLRRKDLCLCLRTSVTDDDAEIRGSQRLANCRTDTSRAACYHCNWVSRGHSVATRLHASISLDAHDAFPNCT